MYYRLSYLVVTLMIFSLEVLIATVWSHHHFIRAYGGDFLVVILIYTAWKVVWNSEPYRLAWGVLVFAVLVELAQYLNITDHLQLGADSVARVVVGTSFSWLDILMYALGCLAIYVVDKRFYRAGAYV